MAAPRAASCCGAASNPSRLALDCAVNCGPMDDQLIQLSDTLTAARSLEDLTRPLLAMLQAVTGLESTYLTTVDEAGGTQHVLYSNNSKQLQIPEGVSFPWNDTLCKRALEENCMFTNQVAERWGDSEAAKALGIHTYLSKPVHTESGGLYGTLCAAGSDRLPLPENAAVVLDMFSKLISQHVEREMLMSQLREANAQLESYAHTDTLTGLANRRSLVQELTRLLARGQREQGAVFVAFIDLDGFKEINDVHGHEIGDRFLAAMAAHLSQDLRAGDLLARLGGDEFVVAGPAPDGNDAAEVLRRTLAQRTIGRFDLGRVILDYRGASVGVVSIEPGACNAERALVLADAAMYAVKRNRKIEIEHGRASVAT